MNFGNFYLVFSLVIHTAIPTFLPTLMMKLTMKEWSSKLILLQIYIQTVIPQNFRQIFQLLHGKKIPQKCLIIQKFSMCTVWRGDHRMTSRQDQHITPCYTVALPIYCHGVTPVALWHTLFNVWLFHQYGPLPLHVLNTSIQSWTFLNEPQCPRTTIERPTK